MQATVKRFQIENTRNVWQTAEARKISSEFRINIPELGKNLVRSFGQATKRVFA
jgi:hypothetical protein